MKAFSESHPALTAWAGLILLFDGEVWRNTTLPLRVESAPDCIANHDEHSQTGILTSGLEPHSRLPGPALRDQWPWEFVTRYSGATVPDSHGVP